MHVFAVSMHSEHGYVQGKHSLLIPNSPGGQLEMHTLSFMKRPAGQSLHCVGEPEHFEHPMHCTQTLSPSSIKV